MEQKMMQSEEKVGLLYQNGSSIRDSSSNQDYPATENTRHNEDLYTRYSANQDLLLPCSKCMCQITQSWISLPFVCSQKHNALYGGWCSLLSSARFKGVVNRRSLIALVFIFMLLFSAFNIVYFRYKPTMRTSSSAQPMRNGDLKQRLPQCLIFGVRKCGTRALLEFLNLHSEIEIAHYEMHFFDNETRYKEGFDWYLSQMPFTYPEQITIEKTPGYFINQLAAERIWRMNDSIKLVLIVRDPVSRMVSDYVQIREQRRAKNLTYFKFEDLALNPETGELDLNYRPLQISLYHKHFRWWWSLFLRSQIHIVDGDKLIKHPPSELSKVEKFLGLEHQLTDDHFYHNETRGMYCMRNDTYARCLSPSKGRPHPTVDKTLISKLRTFFRPHNEEFFQLTGLHFDWL